MKKDKKPDLVVFNEETNSYDAALKPYGTSASSPVIQPLNTATWKNDGIQRVNKKLASEFEEIKQQYSALLEKFKNNEILYNAKYNFEPILGETYFLYKDRKGEAFLSIIAPNQCNFDYQGAFRLNSDKMWEEVETDTDAHGDY
ncbi:MAG: GTP-binding protein [Flavobacteriaceae bacterium]|nr:GTP-binding protein [Flavobacteriaceae bacterium]|tara:strand:- start:227564 stop:227995 length:432 start_codon:yes stop_codon:yes gene_type:complete